MIRRLDSNDHEECFHFLKGEAAENVFIIGDIEAYGYEQEFQRVWGEFNEKNELIAVLLKYRENYIPYAKTEEFDGKGFAEIILADGDFTFLSGLERCTTRIEPFLSNKLKKKRQFYYAKCTALSEAAHITPAKAEVKLAVPNDAHRLVHLLKAIPEFSDSIITEESKKESLEGGASRTFYIEKDGKMVSTASTTAENSSSAMVVGVATDPAYKKQGLASACMMKLCKELLGEGKELCLFYDNPEAGTIYKKLGFEDIGFWVMNIYHR
ncbi:GNAT family N-acetyltransferase [Gracilibacillus sp. Marseille-QA3620]